MGFQLIHRPECHQDIDGTKMTERKTPPLFNKAEVAEYHSEATKTVLSFSIERILGIDSKRQTSDVLCSAKPAPKTKQPQVESLADLPWLSYTRYSPPKLPRAKRRKNITRKSSGNPRVPFSTSQLMTLEHKYLQKRYLSSSEVTTLSDTLSLSEHRIKIWFQNRRAREKKTQTSSWSSKVQTNSGPPRVFDHTRHLVPSWLDEFPDRVWTRDLCGIGQFELNNTKEYKYTQN